MLFDTAAIVPNCGRGFYGQKCHLTCPFPYFGFGCAQKCNCKKEMCNHVQGCHSLKGKLANYIIVNNTFKYDRPVIQYIKNILYIK